MTLFGLTTLVIALTALLGFVNARFVRLPNTIGLMVLSLGLSLALLAAGELTPVFRAYAVRVVQRIDFNEALLHGMLAFLLFAAALYLDLGDLLRQWLAVTVLSFAGTIAAMFLVGGLSFLAARSCGVRLPMGACLLLGALISPTDPIAVVGVMRRVGAPPALETLLCGESLFNDGVGVVLFGAVLQALGPTADASIAMVAWRVVLESGGGLLIGAAGGLLVHLMLRQIVDYKIELMLTIALAMGSYALAERLHVSGPIASVVAGLIIGNFGRATGMTEGTREHLDIFWELIDEVLNAVLFVLIGLEVLTLVLKPGSLLLGGLCVGAVLVSRWICVAGSGLLVRPFQPMPAGAGLLLTWGGLRGGLSVAMALAIPASIPERSTLLLITYVIVVFSILVQGLTVRQALEYIQRREGRRPTPEVGVGRSVSAIEG